MSPVLDHSRVAELYDSYAIFADDIPFFLAQCQDLSGQVLGGMLAWA